MAEHVLVQNVVFIKLQKKPELNDLKLNKFLKKYGFPPINIGENIEWTYFKYNNYMDWIYADIYDARVFVSVGDGEKIYTNIYLVEDNFFKTYTSSDSMEMLIDYLENADMGGYVSITCHRFNGCCARCGCFLDRALDFYPPEFRFCCSCSMKARNVIKINVEDFLNGKTM